MEEVAQNANIENATAGEENHEFQPNFGRLNHLSPAFAREYQLALTKKRLQMPRMNSLELDKEMPSWFSAVDEKEFDRLQFRAQMDADASNARQLQQQRAWASSNLPSQSPSQLPAVPRSPTSNHRASSQRSPVHSYQNETAKGPEAADGPTIRGKQRRQNHSDKAAKRKLDLALHQHEQRAQSRLERGERRRAVPERQMSQQQLGTTVPGLRRPPFAVDTPVMEKKVPDTQSQQSHESVKTGEHSEVGDPEEQFAWWSKYWADKLNPTEMNLPIHPVETMWRGNFQKRKIPWRKEQLGSFPSYNDFAWPPPNQNAETKRQMDTFFDSKIPYGRDIERYKGAMELPMNTIMRDRKYIPDFIDPQGDLANSSTTEPLGRSWRSHATVGWLGYKQQRPEERYDQMNRRIYTANFERILGIIADKLESHGVSNFFLAFGAFDHDKSGYIDRHELQAFLSKYNVVLTEEEFSEVLDFFEDDQRDNQISYTEFVSAIEGKGRRHPLRVNYGTRGPSGGIIRYAS